MGKEEIMKDLKKVLIAPQITKNQVKSTVRQCKNGKIMNVRGSNKYFLFMQERYQDIYIYIGRFRRQPEVEGFKITDLRMVDKSKNKLISFLKEESKRRNKEITFAPYSLTFI